MKRKYRRFTQNHMYALALVHRAAGGVKTYIREVLDFRRGHKKYDFSRKVFHSKFDVVPEKFLGILVCCFVAVFIAFLDSDDDSGLF